MLDRWIFVASCLAVTLGACSDGGSGADVPFLPGGTTTCASWERPFDVDPDVFPFVSQCLELSVGRMHYVDLEPPDQPRATVVAVHGNPLWGILYRDVASRARDAGFRFIAVDLIGYGMSDKPPVEQFDYRVSAQAKAVAELLERLQLQEVILVGNDVGGGVALGVAIQESQRVAGLVPINTWFQRSLRIPAGETRRQFIFHDWALENVINEPYYLSTGQTAQRGARAFVREVGFAPEDPDAEPFRRAILAPFFEAGDLATSRGPTAHLPHVRLVQSTITDEVYWLTLEERLSTIAD